MRKLFNISNGISKVPDAKVHNGAVLGLLIVGGGSALWLAPFLITDRGSGSVAVVDRRARWGLLLESLGIAMMLLGGFWTVDKSSWRSTVAIVFFLLAALLSWTATHALGRQLRFDAAIGTEHRLVHSGPYRIVRHPIYCSMLCLIWGIGFVAASPWLFVSATVMFLAGTEIRVRIEDRLLARRFGERFEQFRRSTSAYVPMIR
jgi:protein-S-isoprenylcysteine O-methyltransferase Ste14